MSIPKYSIVIIKPMSIGRGDGGNILSDILSHTSVQLRAFRSWRICENTWLALSGVNGIHESELDYEVERIHAGRPVDSWCCAFTHLDNVSDPYNELVEYCGPLDSKLWTRKHLRYKYAGCSRHPSDTVVHISNPHRSALEALLLFDNFNIG